jgi:hypothetical protein
MLTKSYLPYSHQMEEEWIRNGGFDVYSDNEGTSGGWGSFRP